MMIMKTKKLKIQPPLNKPLTDMVECEAEKIDPEGKHKHYHLRLTNETENRRIVEVYAWRNPPEYCLKQIELRTSGTTALGIAMADELEDILKNFGGKEFFIEHEYANAKGSIARIKTSENLSIPRRRQVEEYLKTKRRLNSESPYFFASMHASKANRKATFTSSNEKAIDQPVLWKLELVESMPRGPFAKRRMNRINDYFKRHIEPKIISITWELWWVEKKGLMG